MIVLPFQLAYLDPGTGSLILQVVLGTVVSGWILIKQFFGRFRLGKSIESNPTPETKADRGATGDAQDQ